jgi:hypothetical protein
MPYINMEFYEKDYLAELGVRFYHLYRTEIGKYTERKNYNKLYEDSKQQLMEYICAKKEFRPKSIDDVFLLLELYYPQKELRKEVSKYLNRYPESSMPENGVYCYYIKNLFKLANSFLTFRDGVIAIRTWKNKYSPAFKEDILGVSRAFDKVEMWNSLSRIMVPDVLISAFFVLSDLDMQYLYQQTGTISLADKLLWEILKKGVAETHLHMNAGFDYNSLWLSETNPYTWLSVEMQTEKKESYLLQGMIFRILLAEYLIEKERGLADINIFSYIKRTYDKEQGEKLIDILQAMYEGKALSAINWRILIKEFIDTILKKAESNPRKEENEDFLLTTLYQNYKCYQTSSELILLYQALKYLKQEKEDYVLNKLFIQYVRIKNEYFGAILQRSSVLGLEYFQRFFQQSKLHMKRVKSQSAFIKAIFKTQFQVENIKKIELRIAPDIPEQSLSISSLEIAEIKKRLLKQVKEILLTYRNYIYELVFDTATYEALIKEERISGDYYNILKEKEAKKELADILLRNPVHIPTIGLVFHFIKRKSTDNILGDACWLSYINGSMGWSNHNLIWRRQLLNTAYAIEEIRSEVPFLNQYIVGIDAASNENDAEPWIFAPVFRTIRSKTLTKPFIFTEGATVPGKIKNLGFTYHVGEDFRHVLSGFRHIDEVIDYFYYKTGDRLGHAIALGVDLGYWLRENEIVAMPILEHLENLLWLWGILIYQNIKLPVSAEAVEGRIMLLAKQLYVDTTGINAYILYEVYQDKFLINQDAVFHKYKERIDLCSDSCSEDKVNCKEHSVREEGSYFCREYDSCYERGDNFLWNKDKLLCTYFCPVYEERYSKVILIDAGEFSYELLTTIQNHVRNKIEHLGVYVETNPTSNTSIGEIESIYKHYITKLNGVDQLTENKKLPSVLVTVNSDDPIVFNTNAENELAYIYHALIYDGHSKEKVLNWIDKIREFGMTGSFIKGVKDTGQLIFELNEILSSIDKCLL